jgi:creatinine amidohydrolase/Fe(II)-dependent formamide hydrolase-like protein
MYVAPIHNKVEPYQMGIAGPSNEAIMAELQKRQANMDAAAEQRPAELARLDSELNTLTRAEQAVKILDAARKEAATLSENNAEQLIRSAIQAATALIGYGNRTGGSRKNKRNNRKTHRK